MATHKYGASFDDSLDDLEIEFQCIKFGGSWTSPRTGKKCGLGLYHHCKAAMTLMWPEDDWHRWAELSLKEICNNRITAFMGPGWSNKTYTASKFALLEYFLYPEKTCVLVSSTDVRGLELRVWGRLKDLHTKAKEKYEWLPGQIIDYLHAISTDQVDNADGKRSGRVLNRGIICIPCLQSGKYVGLGKYDGIKSERIVFVADEVQFMQPTFLDAIANLNGAKSFKFVACGNPIDPNDPLGRVAEPVGGWSSHPEPTKTATWDTKFLNGRCVNFVGTDSPNFDFPSDKPPKYWYLISAQRIKEVADTWGKDSVRYFSQCVGVMKAGMLNKRVITKDLCRQHKALEKAVWKGTERTRLYACDAAYSGTGGDRCVAGWAEFGEAVTGEQILRINPPVIIPVSISGEKSPEDQIAEYIRDDMASWEIEPDHCFFDSTGRGTLGTSFSKVFVFQSKKPVPVEFGGSPSRRPVRHDYFTVEEGNKRLVRCDEYYTNKVSELWMSSRYVIECDQIRELPDDVMDEGCQREYGLAKGNKTFVESKNDPKAKERMTRSPDLYDWFVTIIEGARQLGFQIKRIGAPSIEDSDKTSDRWGEIENEKFRNVIQSKLLQTGSETALPWAA